MSFKSRFFRWLPFFIIGIYLLSLVISQFGKMEQQKIELSRTIKTKFKNVNVMALKRGEINDYIWVQGRAEPIKSVTIKSEITKKITHINVHLGQWVQKGDLLFCLDEEDSIINYKNTKAALLSAEANFNYADGDYKNKQKLAEKGFNEITEDVLRLAEKAMKSTQALVVQAQANLENAEYLLEKTIFVAPFDGIVTELNYQTENELVNANSVIARIDDLSRLKFTGSVSSDDVGYLNIGVEVSKIDINEQIKDIKGKITGISASASNSGTYRIEIEFDNNNLTKPEMMHMKISEDKLDDFSMTLKILKMQPNMPEKSVISLNPELILGSNVVRVKIPKGILKNVFLVPANSVIRKEGADFVCEIKRIDHPIFTFGVEDVVKVDLANFISVEVYKYIDGQAIIFSKYLDENIYLAISGHKALKQGESIIIKSIEE